MPEPDPEAPKPEAPKLIDNKQMNDLLAAQKHKILEQFADYEDLKAKASKLDQIEQDSKSELQKLLDENNDLKQKVGSYELQKQVAEWARDITKDSQIPASALRGSTREELEAHFKELEALIPKPQQQKRTPVPTGKPTGTEGGSAAVAALRQLRHSQ